MISFREYLSEDAQIVSNKRVGIKHFDQMKPDEFIRWVNSIKKDLKGVLKGIKVTLKPDGSNFKFGKDANGRFFLEGSRTGAITEPKAFSNYAKSKNAAVEILTRAQHYDDIFDYLQKSPLMKLVPNDTKIECEMMYNPMGESDETGIKFVTVKYDKSKLGSLMTIVPFGAKIASTGAVHPNNDEIISRFLSSSTPEVKIVDHNLKMGEIDINGIIDPLSVIDDTALEVIQSRKAVDKESKQNLLALIQSVKDQLRDFIMFNPNICGLDKLCDPEDNEGIILHLPNGMFKMTSKKFQQAHHGAK